MNQIKISPKFVSVSFGIFVLLFIFGFYIFAWTEPTQSPPGGNVAVPINTGNIYQEKLGGLWLLNGLGVSKQLYIDQEADALRFRDWATIGITDGNGRLSIYENAATSGDYYIKSEAANRITMHTDGIKFFTALAGTAGDSISWTEQMRIANNGNVGIGVIDPNQALDVEGNIEATGNIRSQDLAGTGIRYVCADETGKLIDCGESGGPGDPGDPGSSPTISVSLSANPSSGTAPLNNVDLTANVSGTATGNTRYRFDCTNNGTWEKDYTTSATSYTAQNLCNYSSAGNFTAKIRVDRGGIYATETTIVKVSSASGSVPPRTDLPCIPQGGKVVFYTWNTTGNMAYGGYTGVAAANAFCQQAAQSAGVQGTFKAFLSTSDKPALDNIWAPGVKNNYWKITSLFPGFCTATLVAKEYGDLLDGSLLSPIDRGIGGSSNIGYAWTGSTSGGAYAGSSCYRFTSSSGIDLGTIGKNSYTDWRWAEYECNYCYQKRGIYCIEI
jgi:hypothetical protein